eukprot:TRINITY_DN11515_c0_g1_i1.p1 TRINITY_DN11515_c0_g1~~TRINITY_DN11515_c0_g1_i1.p1  ORF type:complete len:648 (+),score=253.68 TRINITY_DN11515_c0_g1_i1:90-2033(+)
MAEPNFQQIDVDVDEAYIEVQVVHPPRINLILSQLAKAVNQLGADVASLKDRMEKSEAATETLQTEQRQMRGEVDGMLHLPDKVNTLANDMTQRVGEIEALDERLTIVENTHTPDIKPLEEAIEMLKDKTAGHTQQIKDCDGKIDQVDKSTALIKSQISMTSSELAAVTAGLADLLGVLSIDKKVMKELNAGEKMASVEGKDAAVGYLHGLPAFAGLKGMVEKHEAQLIPLEEGAAKLREDLTECDANARDGLLKTSQKLVTKLDRDDFVVLKQQFFELLDRCNIMEEKGNDNAAALHLKMDSAEVNTKVDRLDTVKADRADILNLPSLDDFDTVHKDFAELKERVEQVNLTYDLECREIRALAQKGGGGAGIAAAGRSAASRNASVASIHSLPNSATGDARDYDRIRRRLEDYRKWLERLDELKLDRTEFRAVQDWITNLAVQCNKDGKLPTVLPTLPTPVPNDAKFQNLPRRPSSGGGGSRMQSPVNGPSDGGPSAAGTPTSGFQRPNSAGVASVGGKSRGRHNLPAMEHSADDIVTIPTPGSRSLAGGRLPLTRVSSAGGRSGSPQPRPDSPCEYEQMSAAVPLKHIPAGLRMGRSTPCVSADGVSTNVMVTPKQDWTLREGPLSPLGIAAAAERGQIVIRPAD